MAACHKHVKIASSLMQPLLSLFQVESDMEYIDLRFVTEIQNGAFECSLPRNSPAPDFVSFAPETCQTDVTNPLKIIYPPKRKFEFAVCTKVRFMLVYCFICK